MNWSAIAIPEVRCSEERFVVTRTIAATPAEIFAVLTDPSRHQDTEPEDWVREAVDSASITGTEQMFVTLTYDWSGTTQQFRDLVGSMPPFGVDYIEESLAALDRAVTE